MKVRDKLWLFASRAHDDDIWLAGCEDVRAGAKSRITPAEGAAMLGIENIIMISSDGIPVPFSVDAYGYMESFAKMKNVWWSSCGSAGCRAGNEEEFIVELSKKYPNLKGAFFDDFLHNDKDPKECLEILKKSRETLDKADRYLEMWGTCYVVLADMFKDPIYYEHLDGITIWNWDTDTIPEMDTYLETYEKIVPDKPKMLGMYIYNYPQRKNVSDELMQMQCEKGLKWLLEGRIEGIIFLTNCTMGVGLPSEKWLRNWIDRVGDMEIGGGR